jgi:4-hydroxythreonine-4-phosphate dehydrogenase
MNTNKLKIGITQGDINGCSYQIILKTLSDLKNFPNIIPVIYGTPHVLNFYKKLTNLNLNVIQINNIDYAKNSCVYLINCNASDIKVDIGESTEIAGLAAYQALERATVDLKANKLNLIITNPLNVENLSMAGIKFTSYASFFSEQFKMRDYAELLIRDNLRICLISNNAFQQFNGKIFSKDLIINKIRLLNLSLKNDFAILKPKIAILSVEDSINDAEEITINILKAKEEAKLDDILTLGMYEASSFFSNFQFLNFDAVLTLNYDIIKEYVNFDIFDNMIKYTIGFPFVHLAPTNEIDYENTTKNLVNENSFRNTFFFVPDLLRTRSMQASLYKNSLRADVYAEDIKKINQFKETNF